MYFLFLMNRKRQHEDEVEDFYASKKKDTKNTKASDHNSVEYYIKGDELNTNDTKIVASLNHVYFYSSITRNTSAELTTKLLKIDHENIEDSHRYDGELKPIYIHMLSEGGDIFAALAIYQNIKCLKSPVYCYVNGFLSSAAIIVLLACEKRYMSKDSFLGISSIKMSVWGKLDFLQKCNDSYMKIKDSLVKIYDENTKLREYQPDIHKFMTTPNLLNSETALQYGFITELI